MYAKIAILAVFAAIIAVSFADNSGCPHPTEAKNLILQELLVAATPVDGRHIIDVEVPRQVLGRSDISCITVVANKVGATPDYISFGRNKEGGYSVIVHSRLRKALDAILYIYTQ